MKKRPSVLFLTGLVVVVILGIGVAYVRFYLGARLAEKALKTAIQSGLGGRATISRTVIHWLGRPGIEYRGLSIRDDEEEAGWLTVRRMIVRPELGSIFSKSIEWKSLELEDLVGRFSGGMGSFPMEYLVSILPRVDRFEVRGGKLAWNEREIQDLFVSLGNLSTSGPFPVLLKGALKVKNGSPARVSVHGLAYGFSEEWASWDLKLSAKVKAKGLDPTWLSDLFARSIPSQLVGSRLTIAAAFEGYLRGRFHSSGTVTITGVRFLEGMDKVSADFALSWDGQELAFQRIRLKTPSMPLEGQALIRGRRGEDPVISFQVDCPWVSIRGQRSVFPFLPEKVRSFLKSIRKGEVTLASMGFTGPLKSLGFPEDRESLLRWRGNIGFRNVVFPWRGEAVELETGLLRIDQGRLEGEALDLRLGDSELQISPFTLARPFGDQSIEATLKGDVSLPDISGWIATGMIPEKFALPLSEIEVRSGIGKVDVRFEKSLGLSVPPALTGSMLLKDGAIRIQHIPGTFEGMSGLVEFSSAGLSVRDVQGRWRNSTVRANGSMAVRSSKHSEIDFLMEGRLDLRNLREIESWEWLPIDIRKVLQEVNSPAGSGDYFLAVKGRLGSGEDIEVSGELSVREGSFRLWDAYPVKRVDGQILFSRERISIPHLQGKWKNSDLALRAALTRPETRFFRDLSFSGTFDLRDIAAEGFERGFPRTWRKFLRPFEFYSGKAFVEVNNQKINDRASVDGHITFKEATVRHVPVFPPLTGVEGKVSFYGRGIETVDVEGKFDSSLIRIQGNLAPVSRDSEPFLSIQAESIDFEKVMSWPWTRGYSFGRKSRPPLAVRIQVDNGGFREIPLSDVAAKLKLKGDRISLEEVTFISTQGQGLIRGWLGLGDDGKVSFEFRPYFVKLETNPIVRSFQSGGDKQELSGLGSALGVIRGGGNKAEEIARSLNGEIGIFLERGRIGKFGVLAKVFSLLNPSQRYGEDSPDPKPEGLTYRTITGKITLREGRASTTDLVLDSDSMKISAVGDFEIPSGGLDLRLGLRRIGAGGKVIRAVPVFGEIVTTDRGSFIHYYLEVKGTIAEPEVKGIPYLSLTDGVSGLIHELLETPGKVVPFQRQPDLEEYFGQRKHPYP